MKKLLLISLILISLRLPAQTLETFHDFTELTIFGDTLHLSDFAGKKVLVVNTASFCAFTPQFTDLQALDSTYASYNFEVIGFPCNDFGGQDPDDDSTIWGYCSGTYGVTFQMMSKVSITAFDTAEVYKWLQLQSRNGVADAPVSWNFNKFCIDEAGHWVMHFPQQTSPFDTAIVNWILSPSVTGISAVIPQPEIKILNNPAKENFSIDISNCLSAQTLVRLYSADGVLVDRIFTGKLNPGQKLFYDTGKLSDGIYFVKLRFDGGEKTVKVCVMK